MLVYSVPGSKERPAARTLSFVSYLRARGIVRPRDPQNRRPRCLRPQLSNAFCASALRPPAGASQTTATGCAELILHRDSVKLNDRRKLVFECNDVLLQLPGSALAVSWVARLEP